MENKEFLEKCRPLCDEYGKIFKYSPCINLYNCTREEFIEALQKSITEKKELKNYLKRKDDKDLTIYDFY